MASICGYSRLLSRHCTPFDGRRAVALAAAGGSSIIFRSFSSTPQPPPPPGPPPPPPLKQEQTTATSTKPTFPWLMVPPGVVNGEKFKSQKSDKNFYNFFSRQEDKVIKVKKVPNFPHENARCVGSSHGWLAFSYPANSVSLVNPFLAQNPDSNQDHHFSLPPLEGESCDIKKLILSSDPHDKNCIAAAIIGPEKKLVYCRPSARNRKWILLEGLNDSQGGGCGEIYYSNENQRLYTMDSLLYYGGCGIECWDLKNDRVRSTACGLPIDYEFKTESGNGLLRERHFLRKKCCDEKRYLVESSGEVLMVSRFVAKRVSEKTPMHEFIPMPSPQDMYKKEEDEEEDTEKGKEEEEEEEEVGIYKTYQFEAYRWNRVQNRLETIESLNDRALFVGLNHSFSLPTHDFIEMDKRCSEDVVYYTDDNFEKMEALTDVGGHDSGYGTITGGGSKYKHCFNFLPMGCGSGNEIFPTSSRRIYSPPIWVHP